VTLPKPNVPYLTFDQIRDRVEDFRQRFPARKDQVPVKPELLAELCGLTIILVDGLIHDNGLDAVYVHRKDEIWIDMRPHVMRGSGRD